MKTATLVQATAEILTVISLKKGDVYKRLEKDYSNNYAVKFGVVRDVMHNGEDAVITALEFEHSYSGVQPMLKTWGTDSELKLFTAEPEEVRNHFDELLDQGRRAVSKAQDEVAAKAATLAQVESVVAETAAADLTAPEFVRAVTA